ncbi:hypothetical protein ABZ667_16990 [Streptomyces lavendulae]|uniref:hypothetical protein n=1 Tax=Streptomyces lavendulae TaxID=1914 RepID=UPI0033C03C5D
MNARADAHAPTATAAYLAAAEEAGLLGHLHGHPYVAGAHHDPALDEQRVLIEFCDPEILLDAISLDTLAAQLLGESPGATAVVVRTPGRLALEAPWERQLTYVRYDGEPVGSVSPPEGFAIRPAVPERDDAVVAEWIARAVTDGSAEQDTAADPEIVAAVAQDFLHLPDRVSYLAFADGRPVGHATLLCAAHDDVTGRDHIELLDVLADTADDCRRAVTAALTATAVAHAQGAGLPLIGHVVHPARNVAPGRGEAVTAALVRRGWRIDHVYWRLAPDGTRNGE